MALSVGDSPRVVLALKAITCTFCKMLLPAAALRLTRNADKGASSLTRWHQPESCRLPCRCIRGV